MVIKNASNIAVQYFIAYKNNLSNTYAKKENILDIG